MIQEMLIPPLFSAVSACFDLQHLQIRVPKLRLWTIE